MYNKFINPLRNKFNRSSSNRFLNNFKDKFDSPKADYWRQRIFGVKKFTWQSFGLLLSRFVVWFVVFMILLFVWFAKDLPSPNKIKNYQAAAGAQIFDRNGKPIYTFNGDVRRVILSEKDIPQNIKDATITTEDRNFYHHLGVDLKGMARAAFNVIFRGQSLQSGSTITQQYVKNALLDPKQTFTRKIKEIIVSLEIEVMYSKDQILTMYLNEIPYGGNAYGIEAASQTFYNKHASDLTLAEAATLAALPQRPTYYSPYGTHPDRRLVRIDYILDSMANLKYITKDDATKAKEEAKNIKFSQPHEYIVAPHFAMYVKEQLVSKYGEQVVNESGLKVTTTLDIDKQVMAEDAVKASASKNFDGIKATNAALVAIDPKNGQVLSMVGSADFFNTEIDGQVNVADALRQPGSSFKPIVYATAFKDKYSPATLLWDVPTDFGNYKPNNYDGTTRGPVTMRQALAGSLNIPAVKTLFLAGVDKSIQTAHDMGITSLNDKDRYGLSLVLGGGEVKLIDMATAYGVFANAGSLATTNTILKVENGKGKILEEYKETKAKEVLDPQIAYEISSILSDNNARSFVFGGSSALNFSDRQVAVKTGTTNGYKDAWTIGYTPQLVAGVWVGNNNGDEMAAGGAGAMAAAPIWHSFMASALAGSEKQDFVRPAGIANMTVDKLSGKLPSKDSLETITDIFTKWQIPTEITDIYQKIRIDKKTGLLASTDCPDIFTDSKLITNIHSEQPNNPAWEVPVRAAAEAMGFTLSLPSGQTSCTSSSENNIGLKITAPANNANVATNFDVKITTKTKIANVEILLDNQVVGKSNTAKSYSFAVKKVAGGSHKITAIATDLAGVISSTSINITVNGTPTASPSASAPGNVTGVTIGSNGGIVTLGWTNPSSTSLKSINIYQSIIQGELGSLVGSIDALPSTNSSTSISGLTLGQIYWITLRSVSDTGSENNDSNQYQIMME